MELYICELYQLLHHPLSPLHRPSLLVNIYAYLTAPTNRCACLSVCAVAEPLIVPLIDYSRTVERYIIAATSSQFPQLSRVKFHTHPTFTSALAIYELLITINLDIQTVWRRKFTAISAVLISLRSLLLLSATFQIQFIVGANFEVSKHLYFHRVRWPNIDSRPSEHFRLL